MTSAARLARLTLVLGDEELLVSRAVAAAVRAVRELDPEAEVREIEAVDVPALLDLMTPSMFGDLRLVVVRGAHEASDELREGLLALVGSIPDDTYLVVAHPGGPKGRKLVEACKTAGAAVVPCAKVDKLGDRLAFVQAELAAAGRQVTSGACRALVEAIGAELRELAGACAQLVADVAGPIDEAVVGRYFRGRADASGFVVADRALEGDVPGALAELRLARRSGVDPVLVVAALARQVRMVGRVASAGRGAPDSIARELKLAPWMVDKARRQSRGWTPATLTTAHRAIAEADAEVKGAGSDPAYAVERAILAVATARGRQS